MKCSIEWRRVIACVVAFTMVFAGFAPVTVLAEEGNGTENGYVEVYEPGFEVSEDESAGNESAEDHTEGDGAGYDNGDSSYENDDPVDTDVDTENDEASDNDVVYEDNNYTDADYTEDDSALDNEYIVGDEDEDYDEYEEYNYYDLVPVPVVDYVPFAPTQADLAPFVLPFSDDEEVIFDMQDELVAGAFTGTEHLATFGAGATWTVNTVAGESYIQVAGINNNGQGITLLTSELDLEEGDRITVTGRAGANFPTADRSMMLRSSVGGWTQLASDNDPQPTFSMSHIIEADDLAANIHIHANTWGAEVLDDSVFYIDSIIITRDLADAIEDNREVIYSLSEDAYIQALAVGATGLIQAFAAVTTDLGGTPYLQPSGPVEITVHAYDGVNFLHVGGRDADWNGLDLMLDPMNLIPGNVYRVRVSGRVDGTAPAGAQIMLQGIPGWVWRNNTDVTSNGDFVLTHTLTASELEAWEQIRITTNGDGATMAFYIHTVEFGTELPTELPLQPPAPAGPPGEGDALYSLANHEEFQALAVGTVIASGDAPPLQGAGEITLTVVPHVSGTGNALSLTERGDQNWHALDISIGAGTGAVPLSVYNEYTVTIEGRVIGVPPADAEIFLQGAGDPWPFLASSGALTADGAFTLTAVLDASNLPNIVQALRVQTNPDGIGMSFIIDDIEIVITYVGEPEEEINGEETVLYRLSEDDEIQALAVSTTFVGGEFENASVHLAPSDNPTVAIVAGPYGNALQVTDRPIDGGEWFGIDIGFDPLGLVPGAVYEFRAWGRVLADEAGAMQFAQPQTPWGGYAGHVATLADGEWTLTLRLSGGALNTALTSQTGVRIATNPAGRGMSFIVDEIEVVMIGDAPIVFVPEHQITFDNATWAAYQDYLSAGDQMSGTRVTTRGNSDTYAFRLENITGNFNSGQGNFLRFDLPENIPNGTIVRISWDVFVPSGENPNVILADLVGPGLVINNRFGTADYQPTNSQPAPGDLARRIPMDEWVTTTVEFMVNHNYGGPGLNYLTFRFRVNYNHNQPTVLYIDNINVYVGGAIEIVPPEWDLTLPSLAALFEPWFLFGNIYPGTTSSVMNQFDTRDMFIHHFNAITAENHHKPDQMAGPGSRITVPTVEEFNFTYADAVVDWAIANDIALVGHAFVWHSQSPNWLYLESVGVPLTRQEARANMEFYIRTLSEHFAARGVLGAFYSWDVANEVIASGGGTWTGDWRDQIRSTGNPWLDAYANNPNPQPGDHPTDYIYDAFVFARRYFPYSILYYNDYNEEIPAKRDAIAAMVEYFNERWAHDTENNPEAVPVGSAYNGRLLIEAIGMQSHYHLRGWTTNIDNVRPAIQRYIATGARVSITELDITVGGFGGPAPDEADIPTLLVEQAETFARLFGYYLEFADYIGRVSIWGLADNQSWRAAGLPLLFDSNFDAKLAFHAIVDVAENATRPTVNPPTFNTPANLPDGEVGVRYTKQIDISRNNHSPVLWEVTGGTLPPGLVLHSRTGVIEGVPTQNGVFTFTVQVTNYGGSTTRTFTIVIGNEDDQGQDNDNQGNQWVPRPPAAAPPASTSTGRQIRRSTRLGGEAARVVVGAEVGIQLPEEEVILVPIVVTRPAIQTAVTAGEVNVTFRLTYEAGVILSSTDVAALLALNGGIIIESGRFRVSFTYYQMAQWEGEEIIIIVNPVGFVQVPVNMPLMEIVEVIVLINGVEVSGLGGHALISIDISNLNLSPEELAALSAVSFNPETGQYTIISGGFLDGSYFVFPITGPGLFGLIIVGLEQPAAIAPIAQLPVAMPLVEQSLRFEINSTSFTIGGIVHTLDVAPFIDPVYDRAMLPLAAVANALGAISQWDEATRTAVITRDNIVVTLQVDTPLPNNMGIARIVDGRTFVPVAYVVGALGATVDWNPSTQAIYVTQ